MTDEQYAVDARRLRRVSRAVVELSSNPAFALISGLLNTLPNSIATDPAMTTAGCYGYKIEWCGAFIDTLSPPQVAYVLAHECMHALLQHIQAPTKGMDQRLVNMAMDYVVNATIEECIDTGSPGSPVQKPTAPEPLLDPKYDGWSWRQVYADLQKNGGGGQPMDAHVWGQLTPEQQEQIIQAVAHGAAAAAKAGIVAGGEALVAERVDANRVDWMSHFADFLTQSLRSGDSHSSWRTPNRRFDPDVAYLPSPVGQEMRCFVAAVDTSGSMSKEQVEMCIAYTRQMCEQMGVSTLHLLYWDVGVSNHEVWTDGALLHEETHPVGGGGTVFAPVMGYIEKEGIRPDAMCVLTDGYIGGWGEQPGYPVVWMIDSQVVAPWGDTIQMPR